MAATKKVTIIADSDGLVLGAEVSDDAVKSKQPDASLIPLRGQRAILADIPREILTLSGPDLHRFFSEVRISCDGQVKLPKIKVVKNHMH